MMNFKTFKANKDLLRLIDIDEEELSKLNDDADCIVVMDLTGIYHIYQIENGNYIDKVAITDERIYKIFFLYDQIEVIDNGRTNSEIKITTPQKGDIFSIVIESKLPKDFGLKTRWIKADYYYKRKWYNPFSWFKKYWCNVFEML